MSEELRPCPFCGGRAYVWNELGYNVDGGITASAMLWFVGCTSCPAVMGASEKDAVITAWNKRYEPTQHETLLAEVLQEALRDQKADRAYERGRLDERLQQRLLSDAVVSE